MAGFRLRIADSARKDFESLPHPFKRHINRRIHFLKEEPRPQSAEPLGYGRFALDAYNLNLPTMDARIRCQVSPRWGVTLGGRNLFRDPGVIFGLGTSF